MTLFLALNSHDYPCFLFYTIQIEIWSVGFCAGKKTGDPGEKTSEQGENQQQNLPTHGTEPESPSPHLLENPSKLLHAQLLKREAFETEVNLKSLIVLFVWFQVGLSTVPSPESSPYMKSEIKINPSPRGTLYTSLVPVPRYQWRVSVTHDSVEGITQCSSGVLAIWIIDVHNTRSMVLVQFFFFREQT